MRRIFLRKAQSSFQRAAISERNDYATRQPLSFLKDSRLTLVVEGITRIEQILKVAGRRY